MANEERFKSLYQKYYWRVVRFYVRAFRFSEDDAQELAQDAFVRIYEALDEYRGDAEWAFLETTARNVGYNKIRAAGTAKRSAMLVNLDAVEFRRDPVAPPQPDLADVEQAAIQRRQLRDAIRELTSGQREALQLRLAGFKYEEVATALRVSVDAVKSRLRDAKRILRERLGPNAVPPEEES